MDNRLLNILLVEDDELDVMSVRRAFRKNDIADSLHVAGNGVEALAMLRDPDAAVPDERRIILLDLNMPKMSGIEFLRELRQDPELSGSTVVVLTTSDDERDKTEAYKFNVAGYIVKPIASSEFVEIMGTLGKYWAASELP